MDRQVRNIGLITTLLAALTIIAVVSPEQHRPTTNTAILAVAVAAAVGSLLALALGSTWLAVVKKDVQGWRERHQRPWSARHYVPDEVSATLQQLRAAFGNDDSAITAAGMPCLAVRLEPRTVGDAQREPLANAVVACIVARRSHLIGRATKIKVPIVINAVWGARGRWPDVWFNAERVAPTPGRYSVRWEVRAPDGRVERPEQTLIIGADGEEREGNIAKALDRGQAIIRHFRGLDDDSA